jgi:hypothetical protein
MADPAPDQKLIVFLKAPREGLVKTRLAREIGAAAVCEAYRILVETLLQQIASLRDVELRFTPDDAEAEIRSWLRPGWQAQPQGDGHLGKRLQTAFAKGFQAGATRVAIIGSDCPDVTAEDIRQAWDGLSAHEVVLGPASDGGYWLIGLNRLQPALFEAIPWSSENVLAETLRRAQQAGLRVRLLRVLSDIDTEADWRHWKARMRQAD